MTDWNLELKRLEAVKHNEALADRRALVAEEIDELKELETEFQTAGLELAQCKQTLAEVSAKNSPLITELTEKLDDLKSEIKNIDVEMFVQNTQINNVNLEAVKQQNLCNSLAVSKNNGALEFARFMSSQKTLIELKQNLEMEKKKLTDLNARFYKLRAIPDVANLDRKITELKMEALDAQNRVSNIERSRLEMRSRMTHLRNFIAKNEENVSV